MFDALPDDRPITPTPNWLFVGLCLLFCLMTAGLGYAWGMRLVKRRDERHRKDLEKARADIGEIERNAEAKRLETVNFIEAAERKLKLIERDLLNRIGLDPEMGTRDVNPGEDDPDPSQPLA